MSDQGQPGRHGDETEAGRARPDGDEGLLETVVSILTRPVPTLRGLTARPRVGWAIAVTLFIGVLTWVAAAARFGTSPPGVGGLPPEFRELRGVFMVGAVVFGPIFGLIGLALGAGILHGVSLLLRGEGSYSGLFTGLAFANVPSALTVITQLLPLSLGMGGALLAGLTNFALAAWVVVLGVLAVRENNRFSTGRAIAVVLIPAGILIGLFILLMILLFAAFFAAGS
ncbi:MAG: YIP1 family protein [Nitriliruptorales bacterium]